MHGFVPATALNLSGQRNDDGLLVDAWGAPLWYSVSDADADGDGLWDFTAPGEMQDVTMAVLQPNLAVCSTAAGTSPTACASAQTTLAAQVPAIVGSRGKDWAGFTSADQLENAGASISGGPSGTTYDIADDRVFVSRRAGDLPGNEFDDDIDWLSPAGLYRELVAAGQLP